MEVTRAAFEKPPVVSVSLTVYFEPIEALQVSHLSSLREAWRAEFPNVAELPPLRAWNRGGDEASLVPLGSWPCPYVMFTTPNDQGSIAIQNDRFICSWAFSSSDAPSSYPGFENIRARLESHFGEFMQTVSKELDRELVIVGSECDYLNALSSMRAEELMVGVATKWRMHAEGPFSAAVSYGGVRLHLCDDAELDGCSVNISLDVDEDGPMLGISSSFQVPPKDDEEQTPLGGLDRAHDRLIQAFLEYTSGTMQEEWGRKA